MTKPKSLKASIKEAGYDPQIHSFHIKDWYPLEHMEGYEDPHYKLYIFNKDTGQYRFFYGTSWSDWVDHFLIHSTSSAAALQKKWINSELNMLGFSSQAIKILWSKK